MNPEVLLRVPVRAEQDVVTVRANTKHLADRLGVSSQGQTRLATAVSELVRNAYTYAGGGQVEYVLDAQAQMLYVRVTDQGPGIPRLQDVLEGRFDSPTGRGLGLRSTRRLVDAFEISSSPGKGTTVQVGKALPSTPALRELGTKRLAAELSKLRPASAVEELQAQNQELLRALEDLAQREEQLRVLNRELEDTNRGVVALYSELEDKAERLREANHVKSMFFSYMSHEFRTPLNSILGLSRILLERQDGELSPEQDKQLELIRRSTGELLQMVNDLLDVAKVEAGKTEVYPANFELAQLFSTLRALFQPLLVNPDVRLVFEDVGELPALFSDQGKLSQILRNFISNALKFTEQGEIRVSATRCGAQAVRIEVTDTGAGIAPDDLMRLFRDFSQVGPQHGARSGGTGLGLSLASKLAGLLQGQVGVSSAPGQGSRFWVELPLVLPERELEGSREKSERNEGECDA
ncbi:ATP-binding protein [Deinococcus peraridilitoris]|uniref:histidine kinase n=1 Tax=Deinococcus peraridilitoris (strain DSM 19664 / LMG 22246 / CIP 109416 / KR-200) TaxID=937777 RepID=K9ZZ01_DEIPD|nr:ATP-binding protein [Deinococcus peraridilitoris]AFZ66127.1 signal transduction histidine kinase [Deinococcus peraridilitoris DSM 19664]